MAIEAEYEGDATVAITYTGGTTGFPKGVMLTNDSLNAVAHNFRHAGIVHEKGQRFLESLSFLFFKPRFSFLGAKIIAE